MGWPRAAILTALGRLRPSCARERAAKIVCASIGVEPLGLASAAQETYGERRRATRALSSSPPSRRALIAPRELDLARSHFVCDCLRERYSRPRRSRVHSPSLRQRHRASTSTARHLRPAPAVPSHPALVHHGRRRRVSQLPLAPRAEMSQLDGSRSASAARERLSSAAGFISARSRRARAARIGRRSRGALARRGVRTRRLDLRHARRVAVRR